MKYIPPSDLLGPQSPEEALVYAEEALRIDVQVRLFERLNQKGLTQKDLADRLGLSEAECSRQIFSDEGELPLRLIAKAFHVIGDSLRFEIVERT